MTDMTGAKPFIPDPNVSWTTRPDYNVFDLSEGALKNLTDDHRENVLKEDTPMLFDHTFMQPVTIWLNLEERVANPGAEPLLLGRYWTDQRSGSALGDWPNHLLAAVVSNEPPLWNTLQKWTDFVSRFHARNQPVLLGNPWKTENSSEFVPELITGTQVRIQQSLDRIFADAEDESFEPGMDSQFTKHLDAMVKAHAENVWEALRRRLFVPDTNSDVLAEMLLWVGRVDQPPHSRERFNLLIDGLGHRSSLVRDSAAIGLEHLGDPRAVSHLWSAIENEVVPELRDDFKGIVESLKV